MKKINALLLLLTMIIVCGETSNRKSNFVMDHEMLSAKRRESLRESEGYFNLHRPIVTTHEDDYNSIVSEFVQG